jgi:hypothetical protein
VLGDPNRQLKPDALVPGEEREISVRGGGADDLDAAGGLQRPKRPDQILVYTVEQLA